MAEDKDQRRPAHDALIVSQKEKPYQGVVRRGAPTSDINPAKYGRDGLDNGANSKNTTSALKWIALFGLIISSVLGVGLFFFVKEKATVIDSKFCSSVAKTPGKVGEVAMGLCDSGVSQSDKAKAIQDLQGLSSIGAFSAIASLVKGEHDPVFIDPAEKAYVQLVAAEGLPQAARVLAKWFDAHAHLAQRAGQTQSFSLVERMLTIAREQGDASEIAFELYQLDSSLALQLVAASVLDKGQEGPYLTLLEALLAQDFKDQLAKGRSVQALLLSHKALSLLFAEELLGDLSSIPSEEILWLLPRVSEFDNSALYEIAREALSRNLFNPYQALFLGVLLKEDRFRTPLEVQRALVRASQKKFTMVDLNAINQWLSIEAEEVLLALSALEGNSEIGKKAFEILGGRSVIREPGKSMMEWVKTNYWAHREKLVRPIGMLGLLDRANDEDFKEALEGVLQFPGSGALLEAGLNSKNTRLIVGLLNGVGEMTSNDTLLQLLRSEVPEIRIATVRALKERNNLEVLKRITREYEREKDPAVKKVYEEVHWVVRNR
jgi:hypothetical protein